MIINQRFIKLIPSFLTLSSLCLGLWSIRFAFNNQLQYSGICMIICLLLDGFDGKLARYLKTDGNFGATLDTLADFTAFALAPAIISYTLHMPDKFLWFTCVLFVVCMALRLARFAQSPSNHKLFFIGVPAPAGAMIANIPLFMQLAELDEISCYFCCISFIVSGLLMISTLPTFALNKIQIPIKHIKWLGVLLVSIISLLSYNLWIGILFLLFLYFLSIPFSISYYKKLNHSILSTSFTSKS